MRVNQTNGNQVQDTSTQRTGKSGAAHNAKEAKGGQQATEGAASQGATKAELSSRGKEIARASALAQGAPDVREDKIAELKKRIAEGGYKIDDHAVADRLVSEHLEAPDLG
jgi:flagellar biosynthesis anti-sigma factor FlgM